MNDLALFELSSPLNGCVARSQISAFFFKVCILFLRIMAELQ